MYYSIALKPCSHAGFTFPSTSNFSILIMVTLIGDAENGYGTHSFLFKKKFSEVLSSFCWATDIPVLVMSPLDFEARV